MKFLWFTVITKKELREELRSVKNDYAAEVDRRLAYQYEAESAKRECERLRHEVERLKNEFPISLGDVVYDLELRNDKGRYAKKNPSLEHSLINEVTVTKNNFFSLIERMSKNDVFKTLSEAEDELRRKCLKTSDE